MRGAHDRWTVLPHGPFERLASNLWRVEGTLPARPLPRVLTLVRLHDGRLLFHDPIALDEATMRRIESLGVPALLVVSNGRHRLDARVFKHRYPGIRVYCPRGARARVGDTVPVDGVFDEFPRSNEVLLHYLDGVKDVEGFLEVRSEDGITLVFGDAVANLPPRLPGVRGLVYGALHATGRPVVPRWWRLLAVEDRTRFRAHLESLAALPELRRVIVGHGRMLLGDEASARLREMIARL